MKKEKIGAGLVKIVTGPSEEDGKIVDNVFEVNPALSHTAHFDPYDEEIVIIGFSKKGKICTAGFPPTVSLLKHCSNIQPSEPLTAEDLSYRKMIFGDNWL